MALPDPCALVAPAPPLRSLDDVHDAWLAIVVQDWRSRLLAAQVRPKEATLDERRAASLAMEAGRRGGLPPLLALCEARGLGEDERRALSLLLAMELDDELRAALCRAGAAAPLGLLCRSLFEGDEAQLAGRRALCSSLALRDLGLGRAGGWRLPSGLFHWLLGVDQPDDSLANMAELVAGHIDLDEVVLPAALREDVAALAGAAAAEDEAPALLVHFRGAAGSGRSRLCEAFSNASGRPLLRVDGAGLAALPEARSRLEAVFRDARLRGAVPCFDTGDALVAPDAALAAPLQNALERHPGAVLLVTAEEAPVADGIAHRTTRALALPSPGPQARERLWRQSLPEGFPCDDALALDTLAADHELNGGGIASATRLAVARLRTRPGRERRLTAARLAQAAGDALRGGRETPDDERRKPSLSDLVLPDDVLGQVREMLSAARRRSEVMTRWGFGERLSGGRGLVALFAGEPGTGKTLCAEILAAELGQPLHKVSIPEMMSKYIGETEKNLSRAFAEARASRAVLLFDEADAMFTKRVKVERASDRFSNMEVNLLLQEIERFDGVVVLTTNLEREMDPAFERRVQYRVLFPFPEEQERARIWQRLIPPACPLDGDVDFERLAGAFELAGGHLRNVVLRAAYAAAEEDCAVGMRHFAHSAEAECRKAGKLFRMP